MEFFSNLWNGIRTAGAGFLKIVNAVAEALVDAVFWLIDRVFDAIEAVCDLVDWTFTKIGDWLSPKTDTGEVKILPPTVEVNNLVGELENQKKVTVGTKLKISTRKAAVQVLVSDDKVQKIVIAGSDKGFSSEIDRAIKTGIMYKIPIEK